MLTLLVAATTQAATFSAAQERFLSCLFDAARAAQAAAVSSTEFESSLELSCASEESAFLAIAAAHFVESGHRPAGAETAAREAARQQRASVVHIYRARMRAAGRESVTGH